MSELFKVKARDFLKGIVVFVLTAVFTKFASEMNLPGFDFVSYDWHALWTVATTAFFSYMTKQFFTAENGKLFGKI